MQCRFRNGLLPRICIFVLATVVSLIVAEFIFRLLFAVTLQSNVAEMSKRKEVAQRLLVSNASEAFRQVFRDHPFFGFTMQPGLDAAPFGWRLVTDRDGFRNRNDFEIRSIPDDIIVIGLFGGSAAFGWGIDGNEGALASHLESLLNAAEPERAKYRVVNLALPGWHYPQQFYLITRIIQHLDAIVTYDGFNEIMAPVVNTYAYKQILPPDFPAGLIYLPLFQKRSAEQNLVFHDLLLYERSYEPNGVLAKSGLYNRWRYQRWTQKRHEALQIIQSGTQPAENHPPFEQSVFERDKELYDTIVGYGIAEHVKYSRMVDLIAREKGVVVLHVLQPFMYAKPASKVDRNMVPKHSRLVLANGHPSVHYTRLRNRFAEMAQQQDSHNSVWHLDLSEALGADDTNWIDLVHPSAKGNHLVAKRIHSFAESSRIGFERRANSN